jgi:hypothetical protein
MKNETTRLTPAEESDFQAWVRANGIIDADDPRTKYDYRGYWKEIASQGQDARAMMPDGLHFPDTYKQHGYPTFSVESKYSAGPHDGGRWLYDRKLIGSDMLIDSRGGSRPALGEQYVPPGADMLAPSRRDPALGGDSLAKALRILMEMMPR